MNYTEVKGDLFTNKDADMIVHCVSRDAAMGAGIAKIFRQKYPDMPKYVLDTKPTVGDTVVYFDRENNRYIANMITKDRYFHKPTYLTFSRALTSLYIKAKDLGVAHIAMPKIGAGLDRLDWEKNKEMIQNTFEGTEINITVYYL